MNTELLEALTIIEQEKKISRQVLIEGIEQSLLQACKSHFGNADNIRVNMDPETCDYRVVADRRVVEKVEDPALEISVEDAQKIDSSAKLDDVVAVEIESQGFGRIATQKAKSVILQKIREEERKVLYEEYYEKEHQVITGTVQRNMGRNVSINLGRIDAFLPENEQARGESYRPGQRLKVYVLEVKDTSKGPRIQVSRTHPELVKRLFFEEVAEMREGIIEIKAIAREAGSRTKIAVASNDPDVDPVGACVGLNGTRVNAVVDELHGEKIDIVNWDENLGYFIENALSPAKVIAVMADPEEHTATVIVPDYQLSLAIGREGQNARLAAHLTGFKIDIKSETQAKEQGDFDYTEEVFEEGSFGEIEIEESAAAEAAEAPVEVDEDGNEVEYEEVEIEVDEDGNPIEYAEVDEDGNPIEYVEEVIEVEVDEDGNPIEYEEVDEDGNPIEYVEEIVEVEVDEDGNPIEDTEDGE